MALASPVLPPVCGMWNVTHASTKLYCIHESEQICLHRVMKITIVTTRGTKHIENNQNIIYVNNLDKKTDV